MMTKSYGFAVFLGSQSKIKCLLSCYNPKLLHLLYFHTHLECNMPLKQWIFTKKCFTKGNKKGYLEIYDKVVSCFTLKTTVK